MNKNVMGIGVWAAVLSAVLSLLWFLGYSARDSILPMPPWENLRQYADSFRPIRLQYVYPSLLLPLTYSAMLVCLHEYTEESKRLWSLFALVLGSINEKRKNV